MISSHLSIRTKIALLMTGLLAIVSLAVYLYFPARLHSQIVESVIEKSAAITEMTALGVAEGLEDGDRPAVAEAILAIRSNPDLVYLVLLDASGRPFFSYNEIVARHAQFSAIQMNAVGSTVSVAKGGEAPARTAAHEVFGGTTSDGTIYQTMTPVRFHGRTVGRLYAGMSLRQANDDTARSRATIALVTLLAFGLSTIAVFALSAFITGPLKRIVETAEKISEGDLSQRAAVTSEDEVGQLARSFNAMVGRVSQAYVDLEEWNRTLETRVSERTRELTASEERYRVLFERNLAAVYIAREDGTLIDCNDACAAMFRYDSRAEFLAAGSIDYFHAHERASILRQLRGEGAVMNQEVELRGRDGRPVWALENVRRVVAEDGNAVLEGILLDITDRKLAEQDIAFKAYHDALTELPNRELFLDRLEVALAHAQRQKSCLAVLFLDLDDMKSINDTFGHATGDAVLTAVAGRLTSVLRGGDTVARVGGDEFLVLLAVNDSDEAVGVARKILARICEPLAVGSDELYLTTSIGVALAPSDADDAESLIRLADGAMYRVKESGGNGMQLSATTSHRSLGRLSLEEQLRTAIERDEFVLYYQPQVGIDTRTLSGAEALVRWKRPDGTIVPPSGFMPVCEQSGLITPLGELVLWKACHQMVEWQRVGSAPLRLGVNISTRQFYQRDFTGLVERIVNETGLAPMRLEFEITESLAMQTTERALGMLRHFRDMGIAVAVDDFGTGQSSLSYLKRFPVDTVKIDRSFVNDLITGLNDEWIITAILMLANHLGLRTIAEGVETEEQLEFLRGHDCREIQGYLISKPVDADTFAERFLVKSSRARVAKSTS